MASDWIGQSPRGSTFLLCSRDQQCLRNRADLIDPMLSSLQGSAGGQTGFDSEAMTAVPMITASISPDCQGPECNCRDCQF